MNELHKAPYRYFRNNGFLSAVYSFSYQSLHVIIPALEPQLF